MMTVQAQAHDRPSATRACPASPDDWLNTKQAAGYLRSLGLPIEQRTLASYRLRSSVRRGPVYRRYGSRTVWYRRGDLDEWAKNNIEVVGQ